MVYQAQFGVPSRDQAYEAYKERRKRFWGDLSQRRYLCGSGYRRIVARLYANLVMPGTRVLDVGCGTGELLAALRPSRGVGIDFSEPCIAEAARRHPSLEFVCCDAMTYRPAEPFDYIIVSDTLNDLWDVQAFFARAREWCHPGTRIIVNANRRLWQTQIEIARALKLARPVLPQNWLTTVDVSGLMHLEGFKVVQHTPEILLPFCLGPLATIFNRFLARLPVFSAFCLSNVIVARPIAGAAAFPREDVPEGVPPKVSVVVAARNEMGNVKDVFDRLPALGRETELVFVEGARLTTPTQRSNGR